MPIGQAVTLREGRDVTIVALSRLVHDALEAAERLAAEDGIEAEVIDPRTLVPLDLDDDRRLGPAHRPARHRPRGGRARRLRRRDRRAGAARRPSTPSTRRSQRVGAPFAPIPLSPPLEDAYLPGADEIVAAVRAMLIST